MDHVHRAPIVECELKKLPREKGKGMGANHELTSDLRPLSPTDPGEVIHEILG